uniref:J domain-containing protein n=1 Tax=Clastoptera arizonana TaxID=38151 RepID=A0A1B6EGV0_9HEMI
MSDLPGMQNLEHSCKKQSIDDIIDHMTADLQSYEGQYILLGSPSNTQHVWNGQVGQQMSQLSNPVFIQQPFDIQDRKGNDFSAQHGLFYSSPSNVRDGPREMIGMVDVGGGNFVNVVFNPTNPSNQIHQYLPSQNIYHPDQNIGYIHYQNQTMSTSLIQPQHCQIQSSSNHKDYGLFNNTEQSNQKNHQLIENLVGNWLPNQSGTYSPFGNTIHQSELKESSGITSTLANQNIPGRKPRIVAQVRPMRPSYSDVLTKSAPLFPSTHGSIKPVTGNNITNKSDSRKQNGIVKNNKNNVLGNPPVKILNSANLKRQLSSGGEGGHVNRGVRRWISLDDLTPSTDNDQLFVDYETFNDEIINSGSEYGMPSSNINTNSKKEKKMKKKSVKQNGNIPDLVTEDKFEALNNHKFSGSNKGSNKRPLNINNNLQQSPSEKNIVKNPGRNSKPQEDGKKGGSSNNVNNGGNRGEDRMPSVSRVGKGNGGSSSSSGGKKSQRSTKKRDQIWFSVLCKRWQKHVSYYAIVFLAWFIDLVWDVSAMSVRLLFYLCAVSGETSIDWLTWLKEKVNSLVRFICGDSWFRRSSPPPQKSPELSMPSGLTNNISLPATGDEAMKRLLACKGKDPYSILGVTSHCSDDDIKKYYKRQAVLVHPDKNSQPGAEEAFKILVHAFELIGEPERRNAYDRCIAETHQVEQAWTELSELLTQLHHKMEYAANTIRCTNCGKRHKRTVMQRPIYAARFCAQCKIHHSAREGDIWAESCYLGFMWRFYACMEGAVYDISEWAGCQADNLKHLKANSHVVQYRIVLGKQSANYKNKDNISEPNLEEFLNNLYAQSGSSNGNNVNDNFNKRRKSKKKK